MLDNSETQFWQVRNIHATEAHLPSVVCLIPGPDADAVRAASRLRLRLLNAWTKGVRGTGNSLLQYFLFVFKQGDDEHVQTSHNSPNRNQIIISIFLQNKKLQNLSFEDKMRLRRTSEKIREVFARFWSERPEFATLTERISETNTVLLNDGDKKYAGE